MDSLFKALADRSRRDLLDALRTEDGQTLSELEAKLPLSRFGVAKHLKLLEEAGLVTRIKRGRFTHHYLNAVPLAEALGRWIEPYRVAPAVRGVLDLKARLEAPQQTVPDCSLTTYIRCEAVDLWAALIGASDGPRAGRLLTQQPSHSITTELPPVSGADRPSRVVLTITAEGDHCRLTLEHYDLPQPVAPGDALADGWARWAAGLKTRLETGETVFFDPSG